VIFAVHDHHHSFSHKLALQNTPMTTDITMLRFGSFSSLWNSFTLQIYHSKKHLNFETVLVIDMLGIESTLSGAGCVPAPVCVNSEGLKLIIMRDVLQPIKELYY
jgi:hypothetical protein